jgi:molybdate transport system substrate-binding protein
MILRSFLLALGLLSIAAPAVRAEVLVFAAASLKEPLDRMAANFGDVVVSYGGSGTLARQVSLGAPADVVLLANMDWIDVLANNGHVQPDSVTDIASNRLVVIGQTGVAQFELEAAPLSVALGDGRIAVGLTNAVPAGIYAKAALQELGLWNVASDHLAEVDSVRSALALVARGQAPLGIVYQTDVRVSDAVVQLAVFPKDSHPPIRYLGALTPGATPEAAGFLAYISRDEGQGILAEAGFLAPLANRR